MPIIATPDRVTLHYREGSSDKVYQAAVEPAGTGFHVTFAFGRRNSTLQTGIKTSAPVDYADAKVIFDRLVLEKTRKGYSPGEAGTVYQGTPNEPRATGILPQLLTPVTEDEATGLLEDPAWWAQEKFDGKRVLIRRSGDSLTGINRQGLTIALPTPIVQAVMQLPGRQWILDGEAIGDTFVAFDLLEQACVNLRAEAYIVRHRTLQQLVLARQHEALLAVETAMTAASKRAMLAGLKRAGREGVVFKRHAAAYVPGRPASGGDQRKLKFTATASCIAGQPNDGKRSIALVLLDGTARVPVGNVTIPFNFPVPSAGCVVEVRYLYAYPGGALYQPVYLGPRDDIDAAACTLRQLKYKAEPDETEA